MSRLELPHEQWAELRDADQIPRKLAKQYRNAFFAVAMSTVDAAGGADVNALDPQGQAQVGMAMVGNGTFDVMAAATEALVFAVVSDWSFGPVDQDTLDNMPDTVVDAINEAAVAGGYIEKLNPDFGVSPDPESPTTPS